MSRRLILLDTNIVILASQGKFDLLSLFDLFDDVLISVVTQVEALGFNFVRTYAVGGKLGKNNLL